MTQSTDTIIVRVTHRFDASAQRVYDAFLDPRRASKFLFATATGQIVRCDIDARVGGRFTIVDRRAGTDVAHTGEYLALEPPRRIAFTLSVEQYSSERSTVTIDITPLDEGCALTLTQELPSAALRYRDRTEKGWRDILEIASEVLVDETPTCGVGLAQHSSIPSEIAVMFSGLADTLALHRTMLIAGDERSRAEDEVYRDLSERWSDIAELVERAAATMAAQRDLSMAAHDPTAWSSAHLRAFEKFVKAQSQLLSRLRVAAERDEQILASMTR
jgi:uncharacterized protein YndB with AHSA1/START domain